MSNFYLDLSPQAIAKEEKRIDDWVLKKAAELGIKFIPAEGATSTLQLVVDMPYRCRHEYYSASDFHTSDEGWECLKFSKQLEEPSKKSKICAKCPDRSIQDLEKVLLRDYVFEKVSEKQARDFANLRRQIERKRMR